MSKLRTGVFVLKMLIQTIGKKCEKKMRSKKTTEMMEIKNYSASEKDGYDE